MSIEEALIGQKVKISYDRHNVDSYCSVSSDIDTMEGTVKNICGDMIFILYPSVKTVESVQKGLFSDKVIYSDKKILRGCLINMRYVIRIDFID